MTPGVAKLFERLRSGDPSALNDLVTALYPELRRIAASKLRAERAGHTLQPTALVHEAYLKLIGDDRRFTDRVHFLAVAARVMRQVLVDYARSRATAKRAGGSALPHPSRLQVEGESGVELVELLDLDFALDGLAAEDHQLARLIEMRYFGGMSAEDTAEALGLSVHVVRHDMQLAQAWLRRRLGYHPEHRP
jgi:RNA polymerase sigma factor (TIGR02999 family)